ncbi:MAG: aminopeptidase N [Parvularculaceae bacterium]
MPKDAAPDHAAPKPVRLADYRPPDYLIDRVHLDFSLDPTRTEVKARLDMRRADGAAADAPLVLNGEKIELVALACNGETLAADRYKVDETSLTITDLPAAFTLDVKTACAPEANAALSGLYVSNEMFCTQCEAEGFRRITYFLDRPDVLARYSVRIEADKAKYPVLLSNGNKIAEGELEGGRHFAEWEDPHPKPSYLFALVGGDLVAVEDSFTTMSGREVALKVFVQPKNKDKCAYTLDSLKRAMKWDEETFGREYDLDIFMIVAVDHFNFGAMENKSLNIFNSAYVLASPETATDIEFETIESIVGHEYFHNWSGNRVTCRDWFQLCLKEGFTVFRDQEFSSDMRSRPVQRIKDVRNLWSRQFPEDAGPLAHPPRPNQYVTIDNFYTATVYQKGAELARMMKTLLGPEKFRNATDLYFARHDGEAATIEDFIKAMEDGGGIDLSQFRRWYTDAGAPEITIEESYDPAARRFTATLAQKTAPTPGQDDKPPRHMPVKIGLYDAETGAVFADTVLNLKEDRQEFVFENIAARPVLSVFQAFSAPVRIKREQLLGDRLALLRHDQDPFNKWAQGYGLWTDLCLTYAGLGALDDRDAAIEGFTEALRKVIAEPDSDPALIAELLRTPSEADIARIVEIVDPGAIASGRRAVREQISCRLEPELRDLYDSLKINAPYAPDAEQAGKRALRNAALSLLVAAGDSALAAKQIETASNMTDEAAATAALAVSTAPERAEALDRFYAKWKGDPLVVNKWLAWRALRPGAGALSDVEALVEHEAFDLKNPNKVRALIGVFAAENLTGFHRADGAGYRFFVDRIIELDAFNPMVAARLLTAVENWRKLEEKRRTLLIGELQRLVDSEARSANVFEIASRLLGENPAP